MSMRPDRNRASILRQVGALLCAVLVAGTAIELHDLGNHHRDLAAGQLLEEAASHPTRPHHFDHSEERREPACATCALQTQARGVQPDPTGRIEPAADRLLGSSAPSASTLSSLFSSSAPRGPPAR